VFQFPSSGIDPAILIVCPTTVVTISLKVTATLVAAVQAELVVLLWVTTVLVELLAVVLVEAAEEETDPPDMAMSAHVR
jgi:hypothetical protein